MTHPAKPKVGLTVLYQSYPEGQHKPVGYAAIVTALEASDDSNEVSLAVLKPDGVVFKHNVTLDEETTPQSGTWRFVK